MRIFIAEHEVELIEHIKQCLNTAGDIFDVQQNGDLAMQFILTAFEEYDLIILDASLPKIEGSEICARLREKDVQAPILMLVSPQKLGEESKTPTRCADEYLVKPFSKEEMCFRVSSLLSRTTVLAPALITREGIAFNVRERTIVFDSTTLKLTFKESALLESLMLHPNEVISRHDLSMMAWGENTTSSSNRVDVHIKNLRKKLKVLKDMHLLFRIESIRGRGYRFTE